MSLRSRNNISAAVFATLLVAILSGCGFRPLHLRQSPQALGTLAQIHVATISDRIGQKLHNLLLQRLSPRGEAENAPYTLRISLQHSTEQLAVQKSAIATRANLRVTANFSLIDNASHQTKVSGSKLVVAGYDIMSSDYATLIAEKDAENRALTEIADELRTQLAVYLNRAKHP